MQVIDKIDRSKVYRVQSNMQQILFSAENTVQGVFLCILTVATVSESPTTHHRLKCQKYTEGIYSLKHTNMDFTCLHIGNTTKQVGGVHNNVGVHINYRNNLIKPAINKASIIMVEEVMRQ